MSAALAFPCPACQRPIRVPHAFAGQEGKCPRCRAGVEVPSASLPLGDAEATQALAQVKPCPSCGEPVREAARKCRHCGDYFDETLRQRKHGEGNYRLASPWDRMLAYLADRALLVVPAALLLVGVGALTPTPLSGDQALVVALLGGSLWATLVCAFQWFLMARQGVTLGKRWRKILVLRDDGQPVDFMHGVLLRSWIPVCMIVGGTMFYVIGCAFVVVDKLFILGDGRRCLHDHLASTIVVEQGHWGFEGVALPAAESGADSEAAGLR